MKEGLRHYSQKLIPWEQRLEIIERAERLGIHLSELRNIGETEGRLPREIIKQVEALEEQWREAEEWEINKLRSTIFRARGRMPGARPRKLKP